MKAEQINNGNIKGLIQHYNLLNNPVICNPRAPKPVKTDSLIRKQKTEAAPHGEKINRRVTFKQEDTNPKIPQLDTICANLNKNSNNTSTVIKSLEEKKLLNRITPKLILDQLESKKVNVKDFLVLREAINNYNSENSENSEEISHESNNALKNIERELNDIIITEFNAFLDKQSQVLKKNDRGTWNKIIIPEFTKFHSSLNNARNEPDKEVVLNKLLEARNISSKLIITATNCKEKELGKLDRIGSYIKLKKESLMSLMSTISTISTITTISLMRLTRQFGSKSREE